MGALALTDREKFSRGFGPLSGGVVALPDAELAQAVNAQTAAVAIEPIRGEGGCISFPHLQTLREACDRHGALLVDEEIQWGLGRSGTRMQQPTPDIRTLVRALGGGLPVGAVLAGPHVAHVFEPGDRGATFDGNSVACAAGLAILQEILERDLTEQCRVLGEQLRAFTSTPGEDRGDGLGPGSEPLAFPVLGLVLGLTFPSKHRPLLVF